MKRKYANYPNWDRVLKKDYKNKYFCEIDFEGNISLLTAVKVKEKLVDYNNLVILDDNFKWLQFYPENNKNIAVSVCINNKNEILQWYFDIAKDSSLTEEGVPYIDDLYLDVILAKDGEIKVIDQDELQEALDNKIIMQEDFDLAYRVADDLINQINGNFDKIISFTEKYFNMLTRSNI